MRSCQTDVVSKIGISGILDYLDKKKILKMSI